MANYYRLTEKNLYYDTKRLKYSGERFRQKSFKVVRHFKLDVHGRFDYKSKYTTSFKPLKVLKKRIKVRVPSYVLSLPRYVQHKIVKRPKIKFKSSKFFRYIKRAKSFFSFSNVSDTSACFFLSYRHIKKKSTIFYIYNSNFFGHNNVFYSNSFGLGCRSLFFNYANPKPNMEANSLFSKRLVYKAEYMSRDLFNKTRMSVFNTLGKFKLVYTVSSSKVFAKRHQRLFIFPHKKHYFYGKSSDYFFSRVGQRLRMWYHKRFIKLLYLNQNKIRLRSLSNFLIKKMKDRNFILNNIKKATNTYAIIKDMNYLKKKCDLVKLSITNKVNVLSRAMSWNIYVPDYTKLPQITYNRIINYKQQETKIRDDEDDELILEPESELE